ncbi:hypothetical protein V500_10927 [Pseudogymnoascus sp. VKM F-4518 (FW-2643)]|nr:hypothetical protein V500_10927 [Pseudogymnoascus sp. VKM F-4518 (FW-2643)]
MYYKLEQPGQEGTLKSLVSKFESLSSPSKNLNSREKASREQKGDGKDGKPREKGWRTVVVLKIRMKGSDEEQSPRNSSETHSADAKRLSPMNSGGLGPFVKNRDTIDLKCQTSPIVRGKKEGPKWQGGVGVKIEDGDSQTSLFDGNIKACTEAGPKTEHCGDRKESVVQMRIRLLEHSQGTQQKQKPTFPKEKTVVRSVTSPKVSLKMHAPCSATQKLETAAGDQQEPTESQTFKVPFYRFGTRNSKEASPKSLAPIIRERMKMFETRDGANVNLTALDGPSACLRGRINGRGKVGWPSPATSQNKTMSAFSKCLAERKRSRTGCMVDGKYVSAFAFRRKAKETSSSTSWATTTASRESEPASLNGNSIKQTSSRPTNGTNGISSRYILQPLLEQQLNSSRLPISSSSTSESRANTISDWSYDSHEASPLPPTEKSILPRSAGMTDTLPHARNIRATENIATTDGHEQFASSQRIPQEHAGRDNTGSAGIRAWVDSESSDDEDGALIVQSVAKLREPKPLRITEVSSLAKICRLGRSRGDLE